VGPRSVIDEVVSIREPERDVSAGGRGSCRVTAQEALVHCRAGERVSQLLVPRVVCFGVSGCLALLLDDAKAIVRGNQMLDLGIDMVW